MKIRIHAHHFKITEALTEHVNEKFSSIASHDSEITSIEVTLIVETKINKVEAKIHVPGADIFASADNEDMYVAIDKLIPKLDKQIIKHKQKAKKR